MNNKKIIVKIKNNGSLLLDTDGFKGESCVESVKNLFKQFLEIDNIIEVKSDYYEKEEEIFGGNYINL